MTTSDDHHGTEPPERRSRPLDVGPLHPRAEMQGPQVGHLGDRRLPQLGALPYAVEPAASVRDRLVPIVAVVAAGGIAATAVIAWSATQGADGPETASGTPRTELAVPTSGVEGPAVTPAPPGGTAAPTTAPPTPSTPPAPADDAPRPAPEARPAVLAPPTQAWFAGGRLVLVGAVPDQRIADALRNKAAAIVGEGQVVDGFTIDPAAPVPAGLPVVVAEQIRFGLGQADVEADFLPLVQAWKAILDANPGVRMRVTGFTDSTGSAARNRELSVERAQAVAGWMQARGLDADRFEVVGAGADAPLADNATDEGRAVNRRIQVTLDGLLMA